MVPKEKTHSTANSIRATTAFVNLENTTDGSNTSVGQNFEQRATRRQQELTTAQQAQHDTTTPMNYTFVTDTTARSIATDETFTPANQSAGATTCSLESWCDALLWCHVAVAVVGIIANKVTFITLMKNGDMFSPAICLLLKHQSLVDLSACILAPITLLQPPMWKTHNQCIDAIICHIWHSQLPYWAAIYLSVYNLGVIALDRYRAVCHPLRHREFKGKQIRYILFIIYFVGVAFVVPGCWQVSFRDGACLNEFLIQGRLGKDVFLAYSIVWFCFIFMIPLSVYCVLYGRVIMTLRRRQISDSMPRIDVIDSAQSNLIRTGVLLTSIFAVTIGFDAFAYLMGNCGVINYDLGSKLHKLGLFSTLFNCVVNPFVYAGFMPQFRLSLWKTFFCRP
ncbi:hypothetical protein LSAT2_032187 [Lamellibrachia satsuma]|nr:hypothetical protein LSAT2_032187 [Lamellibrachia satsuma]